MQALICGSEYPFLSFLCRYTTGHRGMGISAGPNKGTVRLAFRGIRVFFFFMARTSIARSSTGIFQGRTYWEANKGKMANRLRDGCPCSQGGNRLNRDVAGWFLWCNRLLFLLNFRGGNSENAVAAFATHPPLRPGVVPEMRWGSTPNWNGSSSQEERKPYGSAQIDEIVRVR